VVSLSVAQAEAERMLRAYGDLRLHAVSRIKSTTRSNDAYAWTGAANFNRNYTSNGRNQYTAAGSATLIYDPRRNLTSDGVSTYTHQLYPVLHGRGCD